MKKYRYGLFALLLFGLFYFSEGKPCPERTRPHKTRCDAYYKCTELTADKHVWVPSRCEEGLVYEHSLTVCVLPADDWECLMGDHKTSTTPNQNKNEQRQTNPTSNKDADIYIVSNAEDDESSLNSKYDDGKVEIIIGPGISGEDKSEGGDDELYDGSGNGGELVELDGFMPAQNREAETDNETVMNVGENLEPTKKFKNDVQKMEQKEELEEMLQTIKTKAELGQPSTNIDPKLTAHLQRLSQLIDGLKTTYQTPEVKPQDEQTLRPDQLNAFLAHFNIKNKFDSLDPSESFSGAGGTTTATAKPNRTLHYKHEFSTKLSPETKVVLSNMLPHRYGSNNHDNGNLGGGYSNSQIVVNKPEGSVLFSLPPEHHFMEHPEYSSDNTPKISEETLKTVLELSKQMIAQQNVPKVIPNPTYFASPIMQPILLTPHVDSPFSSNYYKYKKPGKRPQHNGGNNGYNGNDNNGYGSGNSNGYGNDKPGTTIIHNNVIPVHVSTTNSGEKEVLDSYGQSLGLYPPHHEERPDSNSDYNDNSHSNDGYSMGYQNNEYSRSTTKRPSYLNMATKSSSYGTTPRPYDYQPTSSTINQYFTPSEHLGEHNVNNVFPSVDNFGSIPRPMKGKRPNQQMYKPSQENMNNEEGYGSPNQLFSQKRPNSQNFEIMDNDNDDNYQDDNNEEESQLISYTYGNKKKPAQQTQYQNYANSGSQSSINSAFSSNNPYMPRPQTNSHNSISSSNSYFSSGKNKYTPISSPISSAYAEGTQLVNVGGNFISFDVFQNSILPLVGNNPASFSSTLNNVEVITCAAGVRQPNITDCTRYYVCSKKDGKVLSYSCPPYTGFNSEARICDAKTYAMCNPDSGVPSYSVSENKRIQMETLKALQDAKRRQMLQQQQQQQQAIKAQNLANLLQQYNPTSSSTSSFNNQLTSISSPDQDSSEQNMLNSYMQQAASMSQSFGTTPRPQLTTSTGKKRKYYCKEGDKIADQTSMYNYFVCYKNAQGQMKGHKMTCSKGLLFCPKTTMCTLPSKCS
ncbi:probable WRKY transcription factor protein 1 [Calliphora vicina]|uniref:probable WRKY transcription factor protein 1 n=1 Tax=Calliphora vicina TaxID=7373 RepID=UPI00325B1EF7